MAETYRATALDVALVAATAKTVIEIAAPSTASARVTVKDVTMDGTNPSATPVLVQEVRYATTGTGTVFTLLRGNGESQNRAALCTAKVNDTVEPGTPTVVSSWRWNPTIGWGEKAPLGREIYVAPGTIMGIRCTAAAAVNVTVNFEIEE